MMDWRDGTYRGSRPSPDYLRTQSPERQEQLRRSQRRPIDTGPLTEVRFRAHAPLAVPVRSGFFVYVHLAADGQPLYVGRTTKPTPRTRQHVRSFWFDRIDSIEWVRYEFFEAIYWAEIRAIDHLEPTFNVHGVYGRHARPSARARARRIEREQRRLSALHAGDPRVPGDIALMISRGIPLAALFDAVQQAVAS